MNRRRGKMGTRAPRATHTQHTLLPSQQNFPTRLCAGRFNLYASVEFFSMPSTTTTTQHFNRNPQQRYSCNAFVFASNNKKNTKNERWTHNGDCMYVYITQIPLATKYELGIGISASAWTANLDSNDSSRRCVVVPSTRAAYPMLTFFNDIIYLNGKVQISYGATVIADDKKYPHSSRWRTKEKLS